MANTYEKVSKTVGKITIQPAPQEMVTDIASIDQKIEKLAGQLKDWKTKNDNMNKLYQQSKAQAEALIAEANGHKIELLKAGVEEVIQVAQVEEVAQGEVKE